MKKQYYLWQTALLMTGLFAGGCTDETEGIALSGTPGEAIEFSVSRPQSRTIYLPEEGNGYAQIDWVGGEHIGIYCEQAPLIASAGVEQPIIEGEHKADYVVSVPPHPDHDYHGDITANGDVLTWGTDEEGNDIEHFFYGAYPYDRINWDGSTFESPGTDNEKAIFSMKYITNQKCTIKEEEEDFGRIEHYVAAPDMNNAYMIARKPMWRTKDHVLLDFDPIMTTLDITIEAGGYEVATGIIQPLTITGVSVFMPKSLGVEYFCYDAAKIRNEKDENGTLLDQTFGKLTSELHDGVESIHVQFVDENGNKVNIPLSEGETVNLMAFLPPIPDEYTNGTKIKIHTDENFNFVATLNGTLGAQHKIHIKLPDIGPDAKTNSNWITDLGDNVKLTSMSIPGYVCDENTSGDDIGKLLDMGVRAFDMGEFFNGENNNVWGGVSGRPHSGSRLCKLPDDIVTALSSFFNELDHSNEFVIIWLKDDVAAPKRWDYYLTEDFGENAWIGTLPTTLGEAKKYNIIAVRKYTYGRDEDCFISEDNRDERLFGFSTISSADNFNISSDSEWRAQFIGNADLKSAITNEIEKTDNQRGFTGIVTIPINWDEVDDVEYTDDEKLIQTIIDCNYKFILDRN